MRPTLSLPALAALVLTACSDTTPPEPAQTPSDTPSETPAETPSDTPAATPTPKPVSIEGLKNGIEYGDLMFAGQPDAAALQSLEESGYKTVVNTRGEDELNWDEQAKVEELGMAYHTIPMGKPLTGIQPEWVEALDGILETAERPILLHCGSGNRVAGLWAVWLVEHEGLTPEEALERASGVGMTGIRPLIEKALGVGASDDG